MLFGRLRQHPLSTKFKSIKNTTPPRITKSSRYVICYVPTTQRILSPRAFRGGGISHNIVTESIRHCKDNIMLPSVAVRMEPSALPCMHTSDVGVYFLHKHKSTGANLKTAARFCSLSFGLPTWDYKVTIACPPSMGLVILGNTEQHPSLFGAIQGA